jgi:raffinose synthase
MSIALSADRVVSNDRAILTGIPVEIRHEDDPSGHGLFLVAHASAPSSRHVFTLGGVPDLRRFTVCHRYEPYWMKPCAGTRLSEVPPETQSFLGELTDGRWLLLVPLLGDLFRFSLRGRADNMLELLAETGDSFAPGLGGLALYVAVGRDPFDMVRDGARAVMRRLKTGGLRADKSLPHFVDFFGWCTWDAFYQEVSADNVRQGLEHFAAGGVRPRMLILDDGWQSTEVMPTGERRLTSFAANEKFPGGLEPTVRMAKEEFGVEAFLVWHSIVGYWGGVDGTRLPGYGVIDQTRQFGEGVLSHAPAFNHVWWGNVVGFVPRQHIRAFFDDYHRALLAQGVDGVKVDSQAVLESVAQRQGGRIPVSQAYRDALEASATEHFDGRLIHCMSNGQEAWYGSPTSTLIRSSIDFFPTRPETHGMHLYANAQVGVWFGEFMQPDWDMFQSGHEWGAYHAAARAISGGPVYVSDKPGKHDFALLKKLVCWDGTVLRCDGVARPTLDVLCRDPTRDKTLLKVWNRNGAAAVVGVFHARSAEGEGSHALVGEVGPSDVPGFVTDFTNGGFASYAHNAESLEVLGGAARMPVTLGERGFELFTMVPIERGFAPIGLADKMNSAGALAKVSWNGESECEITLRDGGHFLAYSASKPTRVDVDGAPAEYSHELPSGLLRVRLSDGGRRVLRIRW